MPSLRSLPTTPANKKRPKTKQLSDRGATSRRTLFTEIPAGMRSNSERHQHPYCIERRRHRRANLYFERVNNLILKTLLNIRVYYNFSN